MLVSALAVAALVALIVSALPVLRGRHVVNRVVMHVRRAQHFSKYLPNLPGTTYVHDHTIYNVSPNQDDQGQNNNNQGGNNQGGNNQ